MTFLKKQSIKQTASKTADHSVSNNQITEGVIWKQLLIFFFPILFGTFFQQLDVYKRQALTVRTHGLEEKDGSICHCSL